MRHMKIQNHGVGFRKIIKEISLTFDRGEQER